MAKIRPIDNKKMQSILSPFRPIVCWKVGLVHGSMVYFEMGDKIKTHLRNGKPTLIGSANLTLWGDDWTIVSQEQEIVNSNSITRNVSETVLGVHFIGQEFLSIACNRQEFSFTVTFSGDLEIRGSYTEQKDDQLDLVPLFLPDGTIIALTKADGLHISAERSDALAKHWQMTHSH